MVIQAVKWQEVIEMFDMSIKELKALEIEHLRGLRKSLHTPFNSGLERHEEMLNAIEQVKARRLKNEKF